MSIEFGILFYSIVKKKKKKSVPKSFPDIEMLALDFLFDHFVSPLARSLMYIVNLLVTDDHLQEKEKS